MKNSIVIAAGGAAGTLLRYSIQHIPLPIPAADRPVLTLLINISGSFLLGFLAIFFVRLVPVPPVVRHGLITGLLGGYTTFSTFCKETVLFCQSGSMLSAAFYLAATVLLGLGAAWAGILCAEATARRAAL